MIDPTPHTFAEDLAFLVGFMVTFFVGELLIAMFTGGNRRG